MIFSIVYYLLKFIWIFIKNLTQTKVDTILWLKSKLVKIKFKFFSHFNQILLLFTFTYAISFEE